MRYLLTGSQMKEVDRHAMEVVGIPSMVLMERAAYEVARKAKEMISPEGRVLAVCGTGNNGGDGIAAARILFLEGYPVTVLLVGDPGRGTVQHGQQLKIAENLGMDIVEYHDFIPGKCQLVIDALFGVGLSRQLEEDYREAVDLVNCLEAKVLAVDIPSGIHGDTGQVMGVAVKADVTVAFGYEKLGTALYPGKGWSGQVVVADIGFPLRDSSPVPGLPAFTYGREDLDRLPARSAHSHKGTFGKVLVAAGSQDMCGAAYLSALAAYRMGAGLVKVLTTESNRAVLGQLLPEAILATYMPEEAQEPSERFQALLREQCHWADVIVLGPGISRAPYTEHLVEGILSHAYVPIVLDADGLNVVAAHPRLSGYYTENIIVTPHLGEMARLAATSPELLKGRLAEAAREYADQFGVTCVLKDAVTVAACTDGRTYINSSGNSAMAKAGSGDVLSGILAGLLALGMETGEAACLGVYIHGLAGDLARERTGEHGLLARELAQAIPMAANRQPNPGQEQT